MEMVYIITGAAGHLGNSIIQYLKGKDCIVRALILPSEQGVDTENVTYYIGDICEKETLIPLFAGLDGKKVSVIHSAGIISLAPDVNAVIQNVNVNGTRIMLEISKENNVNKFVYVSSVDAIPANDKFHVIRETKSFSKDLVEGGYAKTKAEASQEVLNASNEGLNVIVVHPSAILGPDDMAGTNNVVNQIRDYICNKMPAYVDGDFDFVDVRDVAIGCILAAEKGRSGESYILSNCCYTFKEFLDIIRSVNGGKKIPKIPFELVMGMAPLMEYLGKIQKKSPLFTKYTLRKLKCNSRFSHDKATKELGYMPRDFYHSIEDTVDWIKMTSKVEGRKN